MAKIKITGLPVLPQASFNANLRLMADQDGDSYQIDGNELGGGTPGGVDGNMQFNSGGAFDGAPYINYNSANGSFLQGYALTSSGSNGHAQGAYHNVSGDYAHAEGCKNYALGVATHAEGFCTIANQLAAHSSGSFTYASGPYSHTGGCGVNTKFVVASGLGAFNHSVNTAAQVAGHGALAPRSAILGGQNHNIAVGNYGAVILGGDGIKLNGADYTNTAVMQKAYIQESLQAGGSITQGTRAGVVSGNSIAQGYGMCVSSSYATGLGGYYSYVTGLGAFSHGEYNCVTGNNAAAFGTDVCTYGNKAFGAGDQVEVHCNNGSGFGTLIRNCGVAAFVGGYGSGPDKQIYACGCGSFNFSRNSAAQVAGHGALAPYSTIIGGRNHNIESGNDRAVIIGGDGIKLTGANWIDWVVLPNLALMNIPLVAPAESGKIWNDGGTLKIV